MPSTDENLREHLLFQLKGGHAHIPFLAVVADFPIDAIGRHIPGIEYTAWQLLEHMRISQWDILEFSRNPKHVSPEWPKGYWPEEASPSNPEMWNRSISSFQNDLAEMISLISEKALDLFTPFPHGDGQTVLREVLVVVDHNAYHLGQLVVIKKILGLWHAPKHT